MIAIADTSVVLDFLDGEISDPFSLIRPYQVILISPVTLHETLRCYPEEDQVRLAEEWHQELLPSPKLEHWIEAAKMLRLLYSSRKEKNIARMQIEQQVTRRGNRCCSFNDILIALAARDAGAPVWSRDADFELICNHLGVGLIQN